MKKKLKK